MARERKDPESDSSRIRRYAGRWLGKRLVWEYKIRPSVGWMIEEIERCSLGTDLGRQGSSLMPEVTE